MTTINTIQDLIQLLRDQPLWAEELRGILLSTELRDLPAAVRELTQTLAANAVQTNERLTRIEQDVSILKEDVSTLKEDVSILKEDVSTLKEDVSILKEDVSTLKEDVSTLKEDVSILKEDVSTLKEDVSTLKEDVSTLKEDVSILKEDVSTLKEDVSTLKEDVSTLKEDVSTLKEDVSILKEDVSTQKGSISTLQGNMARLNGAEYERYVEDKAVHRAYANLGFIQAVPVKGPRSGFQPRLSSALARARKRAAQEGRPLPDLTEENNFVNSDIIIADLGDPDDRERRSPPVAYALFEVSITADRNDLRRASARAETLAAILQVPVIPAVIADTFPETERQEAAEAGVARFRIPDR